MFELSVEQPLVHKYLCMGVSFEFECTFQGLNVRFEHSPTILFKPKALKQYE